jgi:hypothetical protein
MFPLFAVVDEHITYEKNESQNSFAAPSIKFLKFHDLKMIVYDILLLAMTSDAVCRTGYYSLYY